MGVLLRPKMQAQNEYASRAVDRFRMRLRQTMVLVEHTPDIAGAVRDPDDDKIIACAIAASAQYIVTGDNDLLSLREYAGVQMVLPRRFLEILESNSG